ncbi:MAG: hypothetical protein AAF960_27950, partial [Bacteroidota bacterium]
MLVKNDRTNLSPTKKRAKIPFWVILLGTVLLLMGIDAIYQYQQEAKSTTPSSKLTVPNAYPAFQPD